MNRGNPHNNTQYPYSYLGTNYPPNQAHQASNPYAHQHVYQQQQQQQWGFQNNPQYYQQYYMHQHLGPPNGMMVPPPPPAHQQSMYQPRNQYYNQNYRHTHIHNTNFRPNKNPNPNNNQNHNQSKRQKVDKRELPENNQFFCEACDRGFKTDEKLTEHLNTHCKCNVDGCKFEAAQKLVQIHYKNFHATGLHKKLPNLESAEDVKKYIEERKKNFPSKDNLVQKIEEDKEKTSRHEILHTKEFRKDGRGMKKNRFNNKRKPFKKFDSNEIHENNSVNKANEKPTQFSNKKPTLLEQLLAPEIRHERNILLQCVRYLAKKNYLID